VFGREKSMYSIYNKMVDKQLSFSQVLDIYGFQGDCFRCAPAVIGRWACCTRAVQAGAGEVQGLHRHSQGQRLSVTAHHADRPLRNAGRDPDSYRRAMHHLAEEGIASHWLYKDSEESSAELQAKTQTWLQSLARTAEFD
jgi:guanosine-3',5'-bis(diphosphate) 3'-pyrophosphohydrolase